MSQKCQHEHREPVQLCNLTEQLRSKSRKITGPRQAILEVMRQESHPVTTKEIMAALPTGVCDRVTIYRAMHLLETMELVRRFDFGDGTARFELVRGNTEDHHHHLICRACSVVIELEECFPSDLEKRIARDSGFQRLSHKLEFFGICPKCQP